MKRIYISGKISELTKEEYETNFKEAIEDVKFGIEFRECFEPKLEFEIVNPLDFIPFLGNCKRTKEYVENGVTKHKKHWSEFYKENWTNYMITCIYKLRQCHMVALQKNWYKSKGAVIEYLLARWYFKLEIIFL